MAAREQKTAPRFEIGDAVPRFSLPNVDGSRFPIDHPTVAGDPLILILAPILDGAAADAAIEIDRSCPKGAHCLIITGDTPENNATARFSSGFSGKVLSAVGTPVLEALGGTHGRLVVLGPNQRIADMLDLSASSAALDQAKTLLVGMNGPIVSSQAPVLLVEDVFPSPFCEELIDRWAGTDKTRDQVTSSDGADYARETLKRRTDWVIRDTVLSKRIQGYFLKRLTPALARAYQFEVTEAEVYRVGCYEAVRSGHFGRHRDNDHKSNAHRRFAVSLNLNDGYEGGQVIFPEFGSFRYRAPAGGAVVFSCGLLHEALEVTEGRRFALFTFLSGKTLSR